MDTTAIRAYEILKKHNFSKEEAEIIIASKDESLSKWVASKEDLAKLEVRLIKWFVGTSIALTGVFSGIVFAIMKLTTG